MKKTLYAFDQANMTVKQINSAIGVITDIEEPFFDETSDEWKDMVEYDGDCTVVYCDDEDPRYNKYGYTEENK